MPERLFPDRLVWRLPPINLAVCRIVTGLWVLYFLHHWGRGFTRASTRSAVEQFRPVGVVSLLEQPLPTDLYWVLFVAWVAVTLAFTLGLAHRVVGPVFGLLTLLMFTYRNSWGFIFHTENALVMSSLILGLAPAADAWSIDRWRGRRLVELDDEASTDFRYGWPVQLIILCVCIAYAIAGWSKVGAEGFLWADGATLRGQILRNAYWYEFIQGNAPSPTLAVLSWPDTVFVALSVMSLAAELGAPLVLLDRRLTLPFAVVMFGFHWGVKLTMGIPFVYHLYGAAFVAFVPWDWVAAIRWQQVLERRGVPGSRDT